MRRATGCSYSKRRPTSISRQRRAGRGAQSFAHATTQVHRLSARGPALRALHRAAVGQRDEGAQPQDAAGLMLGQGCDRAYGTIRRAPPGRRAQPSPTPRWGCRSAAPAKWRCGRHRRGFRRRWHPGPRRAASPPCQGSPSPCRPRPRRFSPAAASRMASASPASSLARRVSTLPRQAAISRSGGDAQGLGLAAQRRCRAARPAAGPPAAQPWGEKASRGSSRSGMAAMTRPGGQHGRHVLQRVDGAVDAAVEQGLLDLLGEQALAADLQQPAVLDAVAGGGDDDQRARPPSASSGRRPGRRRCALHQAGLGQGQLGAAGADADGRCRPWTRAELPAETGDRAAAPGCYRSRRCNRKTRPHTDRPRPRDQLRRDRRGGGAPRRRRRGVEVLSSVIASQIAAHAPFGGVVPEIAARAHVEIIDAIVAGAHGRGGRRLRPTSTASRPPPGRAWSAG